jgi:hypothetical protein
VETVNRHLQMLTHRRHLLSVDGGLSERKKKLTRALQTLLDSAVVETGEVGKSREGRNIQNIQNTQNTQNIQNIRVRTTFTTTSTQTNLSMGEDGT